MDLRLSDIKNFLGTYNAQTLTQAALGLGISQPALSESLKRLESDLGFSLFYRSRQGIKLTTSGREFLEKAKSFHQAYVNLQSVNSKEQSFGERVIKVGAHPIVAQYTLPQTLTELAKVFPDYNIEIEHALSRNIQSEVSKGLVDVGLVINAVPMPDMVIRKLCEDEVCVWASSSDKSKNPRTLFCDNSLFQTQSIMRKWKPKGVKLQNTHSLELIAQLVGAGLGWGILPARAAALSAHNLKQKSKLPTCKDILSVVFRPEFGKSAPERAFLDALKKAF